VILFVYAILPRQKHHNQIKEKYHQHYPKPHIENKTPRGHTIRVATRGTGFCLAAHLGTTFFTVY